jgi:hypothetical protein
LHCGGAAAWGKMLNMQRFRTSSPGIPFRLAALFLMAAWICASVCRAAEPSAAAAAGFNAYTGAVEARLAAQHRSLTEFVAGLSNPETAARLHRGEPIIERLTPAHGPDLPGAMLHHWRGTAFVPGATEAQFERLMRGFAAYPRVYAPQVLAARVLAQQGDDYRVTMRVRQTRVITVVLDTTYDVRFGRPDSQHAFSLSRSTRIAEIADAGTPSEHAVSPANQHGFLWHMNTYWSAEERDGGLYIQIESVSLTRSIPTGLGWVIGPFIESVPRESLEFTLQATGEALRKLQPDRQKPDRRLP